uniref:Serum response factor-like n=1 Tax=Sinocyclocheilus anshuiensis TaxID=1608454 RepID=A0A671RBX6_9TELE
MLGGNGTARGAGRSGNGAGLTPLQVGSTSGALGAVNSAINLPDGGRYDDGPSVEAVLSGSDGDSDSGDDEESPAVDRRGVKRERSEMEVGGSSGTGAGLSAGYGGVSSGVAGAKPGKKTRGRVKIKMEFIDNKLRRYTTFSKRKTGIMKKEMIKPMFTAATLPGGTNSTTTQSSASSSPSSSSVSMHTQSSALSLSSTTCWPLAAGMNAQSVSSVNGTVLKSSPAGVMQLPSGFTLMPASHTATIVTSSVPSSVAGHMMYPGAHVMYATSTPTLADGSLTVLNTFPQPPTAMHVSHTPAQDSGAVPQMFLTGPPGTVQIPVSAVPLHSMLINQQATGSSSSTLTELRVVNLDNPKAD